MKDLLRHSFSSLQFKQQSKEKSNEEVFIDYNFIKNISLTLKILINFLVIRTHFIGAFRSF